MVMDIEGIIFFESGKSIIRKNGILGGKDKRENAQ